VAIHTIDPLDRNQPQPQNSDRNRWIAAVGKPPNEHLPFVIAKEPKRLRQSTRPDGLPRSASLARNDNRGC